MLQGEVLCSEARSGCPQTIEALLLHGISVNYISKYGVRVEYTDNLQMAFHLHCMPAQSICTSSQAACELLSL